MSEGDGGGSNEHMTENQSKKPSVPSYPPEVYAAFRKIRDGRRGSSDIPTASDHGSSDNQVIPQRVWRLPTKNKDMATQVGRSSDIVVATAKDDMDMAKVQPDYFDSMLDAILVDEHVVTKTVSGDVLDRHEKSKEADAKALRRFRYVRRRSNSASSASDDDSSQRADDNRVRRVKQSQTKTKDIASQVARTSNAVAVNAKDDFDTENEQSPDDIDGMLDAILVDEHVTQKVSGDMLDEHEKSKDYRVDAKAVRRFRHVRHRSNSASSVSDNDSSQRADDNRVRRVKQSQPKTKDIATQVASSSNTAAVNAKRYLNTEKEQSPDDIDGMLDAILVDENVAKKVSGGMLDGHEKSKDFRVDAKAVRRFRHGRRRSNSASSVSDDDSSRRADDNRVRRVKQSQTKTKDIVTQVASSSNIAAVNAKDDLDTEKEQSPDDIENVAKTNSGEILDELLKSEDSSDNSKKDVAINPWLMEPEDLEQEETVQPDTAKEEVCVERVNPFAAFVMVNKKAETECPAPRPLILAPEPQRSMPPPARPSPETLPHRYMSTVPPTRPDKSPVACSDRYMPQVSPTTPDTSPTAGPDRYLEKPIQHPKASHELVEAPETHAHDENPPATQDPLFDAAGKTLAAAARSGVQEAMAEKQVTSAEQPPFAGFQLTVDNSDHGTLDDFRPSTDAVKENLQDWQTLASGKEAEEPLTPKRRALPEFFEARTRSCADVDAYVTTPRTPIPMERKGPSHVVSPFHDDDDAYILQTAFAQKRVKVVQLLIFGLLGLAFGFLGSFYVQSSCHFLTASVSVGNNSEEFDLHYGMWKYTPLSSVFRGYSYCYKYDVQYASITPHVPRIAGLIALLCGVYSLGVLWVYLVLGRTNSGHWNRAIFASILSGIFQALTMLFFANTVCRQNHCSVGPGAAVSIVSTITWFFLAFEMHYNTPLSPNHGVEEIPSEEDIVASLEMSDVGRGVQAFFGRMQRQPRQDLSTLSKYRRRNISCPGRSPGRRRQQQQQQTTAQQLSYQPPDFVSA